MKNLTLALALVIGSAGCSQQIKKDEQIAHDTIVQLHDGIDWLNANPVVVQSLLDEAADKSGDPTLQAVVAKAKQHLAAGDLQKAERALDLGARLSEPAGQ